MFILVHNTNRINGDHNGVWQDNTEPVQIMYVVDEDDNIYTAMRNSSMDKYMFIVVKLNKVSLFSRITEGAKIILAYNSSP